MKQHFILATMITVASFLPTVADARVVDYSIDRAAIDAAMLDQGIDGPVSDVPELANGIIMLENPTGADHTVKILSLYCQAYKIENPISSLMSSLLSPPNVDPGAVARSGGAAEMTLRLIRGSTLLRCFAKGELASICKNSVTLTAEAAFKAADGTTKTQPLQVSVERNGRVGGFCGNIARYTGIVSREAGIQLLREAKAAYEAAHPQSH